MGSKRNLGLALFAAMLMLSGLAASSALATPAWYATTPVWTVNGSQLSEAAKVKIAGTLTLKTSSATVECTEENNGTVGPGATDTRKAFEATSCKKIAGSCPTPFFHFHSGSWQGEVSFSSGQVTNTMKGSGEPSMELDCAGIVKAECVGPLPGAVHATSGGIEETFDVTLSCGTLTGSQTTEVTGGGKLGTVGVDHEITGAFEMSMTGDLQFSNEHVSEECVTQTKGKIEGHGSGQITEFSLNECKNLSGLCGAALSIEAKNIPWGIELYESGSEIRANIVSGGSGNPEVTIDCSDWGPKNCSIKTSAGLENNLGEGFVLGVFSEPKSEKTTCQAPWGSNHWTGDLHISSLQAEKIEVK